MAVVTKSLLRVFDSDSRIVFGSLFRDFREDIAAAAGLFTDVPDDSGSKSTLVSDKELKAKEKCPKSAALPIKLEIGSGLGEWAVAQALADTGAANWLALELRCDRAYSAFCRAVFAGVHNLSAVTADASAALRSHIPLASIRQVYINHPEPPERTGDSKSDGRHLLTSTFLLDVFDVLEGGGRLLVVTDNLPYLKIVAATLAGLPPNTFRSPQLEGSGEDLVLQESVLHQVPIWRGEAGTVCGVHPTSGSSSYFDRMWDRGEKKRRWLIFVEKLVII